MPREYVRCRVRGCACLVTYEALAGDERCNGCGGEGLALATVFPGAAICGACHGYGVIGVRRVAAAKQVAA